MTLAVGRKPSGESRAFSALRPGGLRRDRYQKQMTLGACHLSNRSYLSSGASSWAFSIDRSIAARYRGEVGNQQTTPITETPATAK